MVETVSHTNLVSHSVPFSLTGNTSYSVSVQGTIAHGVDAVQLQRLDAKGNWTNLDPPIRFLATENGGTKRTGLLPAGSTFRWFVPGSKHNVNTNIVGS
jgi:hypothetical protein